MYIGSGMDGTVTDVITIRRVTHSTGLEKITVDWEGDSSPTVHLGIIDVARDQILRGSLDAGRAGTDCE